MERTSAHRRIRKIRTSRQPIIPATSLVTHWVRRADSSAARRFGRRLAKYELIASEWEALRYMYQSPFNRKWSSVLEIAAGLGMSKGGSSKLIDRLVAKGFVRKIADANDRRYRPICLKRAARPLVQRIAFLEERIDVKLFGGLKGAPREHLIGILTRVANSCQPRASVRRLQEQMRKLFQQLEYVHRGLT